MSLSGLVGVIHTLEDPLTQIGLRRSYGRAIAYNYHGPPRLTQDANVLVLIPDVQAPALLDQLRDRGAGQGDAEPGPLDLRQTLSDFRSKRHFATFWLQEIRVEKFVPWHPFHSRVLDRSPERDLEGRRIRIHAAEDLVVFNKIFDRPKDIQAILSGPQGTPGSRLDSTGSARALDRREFP